MKTKTKIIMLLIIFVLLVILTMLYGCFAIIYHDDNNTCYSTNFNYYDCINKNKDK